jgi:hypothetical protein
MAPREVALPGTRPTERMPTVDEHTISPAGDPFYAGSRPDQDRPHACNNGWVTVGQLVVDPETGEETEEHALYLCRRCEARSARSSESR